MCSRHPEPGAGHPDNLLDFWSELPVPQCAACSLPAVPNDTYCVGHARLMEYRVTDENHWAANE